MWKCNSSTMLALISSVILYMIKDVGLYFKIRISMGMECVKTSRQIQNSAKYDDTIISTISNKINDTYLKAMPADG